MYFDRSRFILIAIDLKKEHAQGCRDRVKNKQIVDMNITTSIISLDTYDAGMEQELQMDASF